jgi:simple sugar transport system ATP-binding protein/ribose transport system ATP-binding protein
MTKTAEAMSSPAPSTAPARLHVEVEGLSKRFGNVRALDSVSVAIREGSVHALVGENGAGKSTLGKVLAGIHRPDAGTIKVHGKPVVIGSTREALSRGISIVAQELLLSPHLTVMENVFLGIESRTAGVVLRSRALRVRYARLMAETGYDLPAHVPVKSLRVAEQQMVEILRAIARDVRLIIMDEPTAALSRDQAERLFEIIRELRARGVTVVYVSHFLKDVLELSDAITVMRDGRVVSTRLARTHTHDSLVTEMLGAPADLAFPGKTPPPADSPVVASFRGLSRPPLVNDVSFEVRRGEILGIAGLVGSGRTELARLIFGADRGAGEIVIDGRKVSIRHPADAMRHGIGLVPEDRKDQGLIMLRSIRENVTLAHLPRVSRFGVIAGARERREADAAIGLVDVRGAGPQIQVGQLSGGNQQKVLFAKWLLRRPELLIVDEPTRGVDVGAKRAIYQLLREVAAQGAAIIVISSELEEVIGLAHRVLAMRLGDVVAELRGDQITEQAVLSVVFTERGPNRVTDGMVATSSKETQ